MKPVESMNAAAQKPKDPTARDMLKFYRDGSDPVTTEQVRLFNLMTVSERTEMLVYMQFHLTHLLRELHAQVGRLSDNENQSASS